MTTRATTTTTTVTETRTTTITTTTEDTPGIIRPFAVLPFSMIQPRTRRGVLMRNCVTQNDKVQGEITVSVRRTEPNVARFYCRVGDLNANLSLPNPIVYTQPDTGDPIRLHQVRTTDDNGQLQLTDNFQSTNVRVSNIPATVIPPNPAIIGPQSNQKIIIGAYDASGNLINGGTTTIEFIAVPQTTTAQVSAKGCLFFAYTVMADGTALPFGGENLAVNRPTYLAVPMDLDVTSVQIAVPPEAKWKNGGAQVPHDANGQAGDFEITDDSYLTEDLTSKFMKKLTGPNGPDLLDGLLAGMWDIGSNNGNLSDWTVAFHELPIGMRYGTEYGLAIPTFAPDSSHPANLTIETFNLLLGLHRIHDWSHCEGYLPVTFTWLG